MNLFSIIIKHSSMLYGVTSPSTSTTATSTRAGIAQRTRDGSRHREERPSCSVTLTVIKQKSPKKKSSLRPYWWNRAIVLRRRYLYSPVNLFFILTCPLTLIVNIFSMIRKMKIKQKGHTCVPWVPLSRTRHVSASVVSFPRCCSRHSTRWSGMRWCDGSAVGRWSGLYV